MMWPRMGVTIRERHDLRRDSWDVISKDQVLRVRIVSHKSHDDLYTDGLKLPSPK